MPGTFNGTTLTISATPVDGALIPDKSATNVAGIAIVGYGVIEYRNSVFKTLAMGSIQTPAGIDVERRLEMVYDDMCELIDMYRPDEMAIEELFFNTNQKTAIAVAEARGVILLAAMKRNEKVLPYLDLPIQHCNDVILKNMNRRSNRAELLDVIGKLRREIPGITLRTTLIAGFPGETEEQFEDLCNFVKEVQFDRLGCFAYSAEENTVAAKMDGQIEQEVKEKRAELVMQIQTGIMAQKQAEKVGQTVHVLCDGIDEESGLYLCRTTGDAPEVDGNVCVSSEEPLYPGQFYDVLVDDSDLYDLYGTVAK